METNLAYPKNIDRAEKKSHASPLPILIIIALCIDLFTPYLIWKGFLPSQIRWVSQAAVLLMLALSIARMLTFNHIPRSFLVILGVIAFWSSVALFRGQDIAATGWGIWELFQFPFVALFIYLELHRNTRLAEFLRKAALIILSLELVLQLLQYVGGEKVGDNLAGLFGKNGTSNAIFFIIIINCLFLGHWIVTKRAAGLVASLAFGVVSGTLAEVKLYPFIIAALGLISIVLFGIRNRSIIRLAGYIVLLIAALAAFLSLYNSIAPTAERRPLQAFITNPQLLDQYLNQTNVSTKTGSTRTMMGRGYALQVGWDTLQSDPVTLLFGYGIGARGESQSLGTSGIGFNASDVGLVSGTSLLIEMQELGLVGMMIFAGFMLWVIFVMARDIYRNPHSPSNELRYAVLLFSSLWPVWLWYSSVLHMRVPMMLYWVLVGYVLAETRQPLAKPALVNGQKAR